MYKMELAWKEINVDLAKVEAKLRADYPSNYQANQAAATLELYFENEPAQEEKDAISAWWESLDAESEEVLSYRSAEAVENAKKAIKEGLVVKSWDSMSAIERKIMLVLDVSKQELIDAGLV